MPRIVTTLHDPAVLAATCRRLGLAAPAEQALVLGAEEVFGWVVHVPGLRFPAAWDTLTGLVAYHPLDNAFGRYACLMRFVYRCYDIQAAFRIDFPAWLGTRPERDRRVLDDLMLGERTLDVARKYALSPAGVSQLRREFLADWTRFTANPPIA
jgi:hypothetical protein